MKQKNSLHKRFYHSFFPDFVVIIITPLAPLEPYIAVADASFNTSIDSISFGFKNEIGETATLPEPPVEEKSHLQLVFLVDLPVASPEIGTPSIT
jgi:hypothetical protein